MLPTSNQETVCCPGRYLALQATHCPDQAPQELIDSFAATVPHYGRRVFCAMAVTMDTAIVSA